MRITRVRSAETPENWPVLSVFRGDNVHVYYCPTWHVRLILRQVVEKHMTMLPGDEWNGVYWHGVRQA